MNIFSRAPLAPPSAIRHGVSIVRKILTETDCSNGLSTSEIYQLALQHPIPEGYRGDDRFDPDKPHLGPTRPPHNEHPVRSKAFLKAHVMPVLLEQQEVHKVVVDRQITEPIFAKGKKGKISKTPTKPTAGASPANPITIKAWVWMPKLLQPPPKKTKEEIQEEADEPFGAAVGVGDDFSHLSKRRQARREEKIMRDLKTMRRLQAQKEQRQSS
ncbi:hypothetical protein AGABI2DRAFT_179993 [Agaricus bisporus var. bisporus H97]|uniref:hypothetical protein n=1 Tax=Agaricus bisporus var. bisporus (strain H97 / ATCC MYA-4626 / FGSC 10389) TaxID=936046 RepID=UPI00029F7856|nr:hypothetical protein AGABI2DRAFT_179993 [Agaricus bisporus var. bisporus H97]EKV44416.1 hypothetical protein AGABI2DRAFT_179993 [Agaricus bisporus var. bisporus H97]